jgi:quinol monooxygenase YgiN
MKLTERKLVKLFLAIIVTGFVFCNHAAGQDKSVVARTNKVRIDPFQLEFYKAALKTQIETSVNEEQGVLTLYAVAEKSNPTRITIFEVYANEQAYKSHLETAHYKKYKTITKNMIKSSVLTPCIPIALGAKAR